MTFGQRERLRSRTPSQSDIRRSAVPDRESDGGKKKRHMKRLDRLTTKRRKSGNSKGSFHDLYVWFMKRWAGPVGTGRATKIREYAWNAAASLWFVVGAWRARPREEFARHATRRKFRNRKSKRRSFADATSDVMSKGCYGPARLE